MRRLAASLILATVVAVRGETLQNALLNEAFSSQPAATKVKEDELLRMTPVWSPWKTNITTTVFSVGELPSPGDPGNLKSAWDSQWILNAPKQNPFYVALPYNDVDEHHAKPEAASIVPWFKSTFVRDGQSVCKDHWLTFRHGNRVCYAQWEDVGPFVVDHWQYVFGNERPRPNRNRDAGLDVSPAVQQYLGLSGIDQCDWQFVTAPMPGPWLNFNDGPLALNKRNSK
jgi:hypothetical protein